MSRTRTFAVGSKYRLTIKNNSELFKSLNGAIIEIVSRKLAPYIVSKTKVWGRIVECRQRPDRVGKLFPFYRDEIGEKIIDKCTCKWDLVRLAGCKCEFGQNSLLKEFPDRVRRKRYL